MYRVVFMSNRFIAVKIDSAVADCTNIQTFAEEGTPVIIVDELEDLESMGIDLDDVEFV